MSNDWAIEAHNITGARFLFRRVATDIEIRKLVAEIMASESTGGIVIYRSTVATDNDFVKPVVLDCETDEYENPENFEKVAEGNLVEDVASSNGITMKAGPLNIYVPSHYCSECGQSHRSNEPHYEKPVLHNDNPNDYEGDEDYDDDQGAEAPGISWASGDDCTCTGPPINEIDPECPEHKGCCKTCGCPPDKMPMVNRGTGWCSELHRKEHLARSNK